MPAAQAKDSINIHDFINGSAPLKEASTAVAGMSPTVASPKVRAPRKASRPSMAETPDVTKAETPDVTPVLQSTRRLTARVEASTYAVLQRRVLEYTDPNGDRISQEDLVNRVLAHALGDVEFLHGVLGERPNPM